MNDLYTPSVSHRFIASFLFNNIPSPLDIAFEHISGLKRELQTTQLSQGGENARNTWLAEKIHHNSVLLKRGVMAVTPLTLMFDHVLRGEKPAYADVVIMLLNENSIPVTSWILSNALPVSWSTGDLDANSNAVLINSLELRYQDMRWLGVKI
ncbi:phage tail protein [Xenorhabdus bovienii]|uniref:phage tail protein n=1 Tax=Xenorhabdus bovienii TaxID=40576 RepID=UPI00237C852C|nr:phage tail protein [Xenorhabdus bovienii]MDE1482856.1 phage tail protein [Xenorhabdus bovienii]MDE9441811.1 phage tail protein [Xenorhabdus bovienii]MDE9461076.1 phage tail protein [Xenorhabdus bovienii]MDE9468187.1 phage tail protein [Xenorhabdus bovienii]